jgi:hypothetical protein
VRGGRRGEGGVGWGRCCRERGGVAKLQTFAYIMKTIFPTSSLGTSRLGEEIGSFKERGKKFFQKFGHELSVSEME